MRPTIKMYNEAILKADNARLNCDEARKDATYWFGKFTQSYRHLPIAFIAGTLFGVLGCLIWASLV